MKFGTLSLYTSIAIEYQGKDVIIHSAQKEFVNQGRSLEAGVMFTCGKLHSCNLGVVDHV